MILYDDLPASLQFAIESVRNDGGNEFTFTDRFRRPSCCRVVRVEPTPPSRSSAYAVALSPSLEHQGAGITHTIEHILEALFAGGQLGPSRAQVLVVQHVPSRTFKGDRWAYVTFDLKRDRFERPDWTRIHDVP